MGKKPPKDGPRLRTLDQMVEATEAAGLVCPGCGCKQFAVRRTLPFPGGIVRYRRCRNCGRSLKTTES